MSLLSPILVSRDVGPVISLRCCSMARTPILTYSCVNPSHVAFFHGTMLQPQDTSTHNNADTYMNTPPTGSHKWSIGCSVFLLVAVAFTICAVSVGGRLYAKAAIGDADIQLHMIIEVAQLTTPFAGRTSTSHSASPCCA